MPSELLALAFHRYLYQSKGFGLGGLLPSHLSRALHRGQNVALDFVRGLAYLHQQQILHLDIKSGDSAWAAAVFDADHALLHSLTARADAQATSC